MNNYLLFAGSRYYPSRAWNDFQGAFESKRLALEQAATSFQDWYQIVNLECFGVCFEGCFNDVKTQLEEESI